VNATPLLLEMFDRHKITGTFFFNGDAVKKHPEIARLVRARRPTRWAATASTMRRWATRF
jgi:peptidoglycan/xylan/chitin deacetylase (PgdA/CDA1 family)